MKITNVPFLSQRDNLNPFTKKLDSHSQCMVSSFTMVMNWLGAISGNKFLNQYNEFLHLTLVGKNEKDQNDYRYNSDNHAKVCNDCLKKLGLSYRFEKKEIFAKDLQPVLESNKSPLVVSTLVTNQGHIMVYLGNQFFHDPYGVYDIPTKNYRFDKQNTGENVLISLNDITSIFFKNSKRKVWYVSGI